MYLRQQQIAKRAEAIQSHSSTSITLNQPQSPSSNTSFSDMVFTSVDQANKKSLQAETLAKKSLTGETDASPEQVAMEVKEAAYQVELTGKTLHELSEAFNKILNTNF